MKKRLKPKENKLKLTTLAFTLIELLAVIVILAIIALIATPIILGIVEDARRDAFLRSVELVVSSTDLDVMNKLTDTGYEYELVDGKISDEKTITYEITENCETIIIGMGQPAETAISTCNNEAIFNGLTLTEIVALDPTNAAAYIELGLLKEVFTYNDLNLAKNTEGMNGIISYDKEGKEVYAIQNGTYCVKKKEGMEKAEVSDYVDGECSAYLTFQEFLDLNPSDGDKTKSGNGQIINLEKYGIRYQGYDPDNYVYFNCSDYSNQTSETCELWRIIGVVDNKVKIIRNKKIEEYAWNDQDGELYNDVNDWNNSTLKNYLNGEYYNNLLTKNAKTENMISPSTWYLRGHNTTSGITKTMMYDLERTTGTILYETPQIDNTNIGLMYPSDLGFAAMETTSCLADTDLRNYGLCKESNWIAQGVKREVTSGNEWLFMPNSSFSEYAFYVNPVGEVRDNFVEYTFAVRPTLYLTSNIEFQGEGTQNSPYKLQLTDGQF